MSKSKKKAVAIKYHAQTDAAPVVIASGYGHTAGQIIDIAEKQGIPVYRDDGAASMFCMLDVGAQIPPELYEIISQIYCSILDTAAQVKKETQNDLIQETKN